MRAKLPLYAVMVSNVGCVCSTRYRPRAVSTFNEYTRLSQKNVGRVANETVTLMREGVIELEYSNVDMSIPVHEVAITVAYPEHAIKSNTTILQIMGNPDDFLAYVFAYKKKLVF